jgi:Arc/MetJ family transcription regulator
MGRRLLAITQVAVDAALAEEARRLGNHRSRKEAVACALREYVSPRRQLEILELVGTVPFDETSDYKPLRYR